MGLQRLILSARARFGTLQPAEGDVVELSVNEDGRLRVASKPGFFASASDTFNVVGDILPVDVTDASNVVFHVKNTGTAAMAAGQFAFEGSLDSTNGSDGTWFPIQVCRSNSNTIESATGTLSLAAGAGLGYAWEASVNALRWVRVRCTTAVTTGATAMWTAIRGTYATEPVPAIQTHAVTGSGNFNTAPAAPTAHGGTPLAASINATVARNAGATLTEVAVWNPTAAIIYLKLFNKTTTPAPATDNQVVVIPVAPGTSEFVNFGPQGKRFASGIAYATTAGAANNDATAIAAGAIVHLSYI